MKIKIVHEIEEEDLDKAKRLLCTDDAFGLLWDIVNEDIRNYFKHTESSIENAERILEKIRDDIYDSGLLNNFN